jgi:hypothetical protein
MYKQGKRLNGLKASTMKCRRENKDYNKCNNKPSVIKLQEHIEITSYRVDEK